MLLGMRVLGSVQEPTTRSWTNTPKEIREETLGFSHVNHPAHSGVCVRFAMGFETGDEALCGKFRGQSFRGQRFRSLVVRQDWNFVGYTVVKDR
jgi:hypothetical protein